MWLSTFWSLWSYQFPEDGFKSVTMIQVKRIFKWTYIGPTFAPWDLLEKCETCKSQNSLNPYLATSPAFTTLSLRNVSRNKNWIIQFTHSILVELFTQADLNTNITQINKQDTKLQYLTSDLEEYNSFILEIVFRHRVEGSLLPHLIEDSRIVFGYLWPNPYYWIEEDQIICTPSRNSIVTGVTTSGATTPVNPSTPPQELHKAPLPPPTLPELPELPGIANFNFQVEAVWLWVEAHNWQLRELPFSPQEPLEGLLACIRSGVNLDKITFTEGQITFRHLQQIDRNANPQFYTESSQHKDNNYEQPHLEDSSSQGEEEHPLPIPDLSGIHSWIPPLEHSSREQSSESTRESLERHLGTIVEETFWLWTTPEPE